MSDPKNLVEHPQTIDSGRRRALGIGAGTLLSLAGWLAGWLGWLGCTDLGLVWGG